ncbi:hypothetical protein D9M70_617050 [compost metagenome]
MGLAGKRSSNASVRFKPRRLIATSRFSAGSVMLPWVWRLASRITLKARAGLSCIKSAMSRRELRLSRSARQTRS